MIKPKPVSLAVMLCLFASGSQASQEYMAAAPAWMTRSAVRICSERREGSFLILGHGTAFGINLSKFGYNEPRYLLSAGHNVRDPQGNFYSPVRIETRDLDGCHWHSCRVLAVDPTLDICLLESSTDIPSLGKLAEQDSNIGSQLVLIGSPRGTTPAAYTGFLTEKGYGSRELSQFEVQFDHGCSGGPVYDALSQRIVGVAVAAGIGRDDVMDPNIGLYTPINGIARFLDANVVPRPMPQVAVARTYGSFLEPASMTTSTPIKPVAHLRSGSFIDPGRAKAAPLYTVKKLAPADPAKIAQTPAPKKKPQATKQVLAEVVNLDSQTHKQVAVVKVKKPVPAIAPKDKPVRSSAQAATSESRIIAASAVKKSTPESTPVPDETGGVFAP